MEEMANKIQAVINTLSDLDIKSTYENMDRLLGCMRVLAVIRDEVKKLPEVKDGNADAE